MKPVIIFDIDGTLADCEHRRYFLNETPPNWKSFNESMVTDCPKRDVVLLYHTLYDSNLYDIILLTGRYEEYRQVTENWLKSWQIPFNEIYMRKDGDNRKDAIIKEEILNILLSEGKQILFTVDDRQQVVDMWRKNGITCFQCDYGDF